jgi:hypothetical protein
VEDEKKNDQVIGGCGLAGRFARFSAIQTFDCFREIDISNNYPKIKIETWENWFAYQFDLMLKGEIPA